MGLSGAAEVRHRKRVVARSTFADAEARMPAGSRYQQVEVNLPSAPAERKIKAAVDVAGPLTFASLATNPSSNRSASVSRSAQGCDRDPVTAAGLGSYGQLGYRARLTGDSVRPVSA